MKTRLAFLVLITAFLVVSFSIGDDFELDDGDENGLYKMMDDDDDDDDVYEHEYDLNYKFTTPDESVRDVDKDNADNYNFTGFNSEVQTIVEPCFHNTGQLAQV